MDIKGLKEKFPVKEVSSCSADRHPGDKTTKRDVFKQGKGNSNGKASKIEGHGLGMSK